MAISSTRQIDGLEQLKQVMKELPVKLQKQVIDATVRGGAREVAKLYKQNLPPKYKTLKRATKVIKRKARGRTETKYTITPTRGNNSTYDAWYAHIVEKGAQPHEITPKVKKVLKIGEGYYNTDHGLRWGTGFVTKAQRHPGVRPTRAMYRAFKQHNKIFQAMIAKGQKRFARFKAK